MCRTVNAVVCENYAEHKNVLYGKNAGFLSFKHGLCNVITKTWRVNRQQIRNLKGDRYF